MLRIETPIKLREEDCAAANLAERFSAQDRRAIGEWVYQGYLMDKQSRAKWERRTEAAMDLAMQIQKAKNFPWPNCSNIAFPLVTIATMQFHSRAYPALVQGPDIVKCRVVGDDPGGEEAARAERVGAFMSWQRLEEDTDWEEQTDRSLINVSVVGCAFKKSYWDAEEGCFESELVYARDLVLDYFSKSVECCPRKTHVIPLYRNEVYERVKRETFCDVLEEGWFKSPQIPMRTVQQTQHDQRQGVNQPGRVDETTPFVTLEQHVSLDLDGDGYAEPYIITVEESSRSVLRIVTGWDRTSDVIRNARGELTRINARQYFTKIPFLPSPDGGIYDMGFGVLLGPLNESVNTIVNQLVDCGTMQTTAGGFLARGAKIRGGVYTFSPFQWNRVDSTGEDLRKSMVPLPVRDPSQVLFQVLSFLVQYADRIPGTTEATVGENVGQNTPAETSRNMVTQGLKIYNALFKRLWRSLGEEFQKLYALNGLYLPPKTAFGGKGQFALQSDFQASSHTIVPVADPHITSDEQRTMQLGAVAARAAQVPGYNRDAVERLFLKSLKIDDIDQIFPGSAKLPPGKDPKVALEETRAQGRLQVAQLQIQFQGQKLAAELLEEHRMNTAKILEMGANAAHLIEQAGGIRAGHEIAALEAAIGAMKVHNDSIMRHIEAVIASMGVGDGESSGGKGMAGLAATPRDAGLAMLGAAGAGGTNAAMGGGQLQP